MLIYPVYTCTFYNVTYFRYFRNNLIYPILFFLICCVMTDVTYCVKRAWFFSIRVCKFCCGMFRCGISDCGCVGLERNTYHNRGLRIAV